MSETQHYDEVAKTLVIGVASFSFETLDQHNGRATAIRFRLNNPQVTAGDVVLVLDGSEIQFHGLINQIAEGWATASDRQSLLLPRQVH